MTRKIILSPEAFAQLESIEHFIAEAGSPGAAAAFVDDILNYCMGFDLFPMRGVARDDLRPGLRFVGYRRKVTIAFSATSERVEIIGVFYGGQNVAVAFRADDENTD